MNKNLHHLIPTKHSLMTTIIVANAENTKIINMKYKPTNLKEEKLLCLLRLYKEQFRNYLKARRISSEHGDIVSKYSKKLQPLGTKICYLITSLTEFRSIYNAQFPKKAKPKKFKTTKSKYLSYINPNEQLNFESNISLDFTITFYDIFSRIEQFLGTQLIYHSDTKTLLPIEFFKEVIYTNITSLEKKPFIKFVLDDYSLNSDYFRSHNNKIYHKTCFTKVYTASDLSTSKIKFIWEKHITKICNSCEMAFEKTVPFYYNKLQDEQTCASCSKEANKYKQPIYSVENIANNQYHSSRLGFKFEICKIGNENSIPIGMELETELKIKDYKTNKSRIAFALWNALNCKDIVFEKDGSLNSAGIEIITNPMTLEYARKYWEHGKVALANLTNGIYSGLPEYKQVDDETQWWGIHLTTARKYWTDISIIKLQNFLFNKENKSFLQLIAQRTHNYGGNEIGYRSITKSFYIDRSKKPNCGEKIIGHNRHTSINITKSQLIEFRFFQNSNETDIILKNYDFITALNLWLTTQQTELHPKYMDFLNWLNNPIQIKRFKYLIKYLKQPYHTIRLPLKNELESKINPITLFNTVDTTKFWKKENIKCA